MPAIITHNAFGQDLYDVLSKQIGRQKDQAEAFLLGNQGPDPYFYSIASPGLKCVHKLGNTMHDSNTSQLIAAFAEAPLALRPDDRPIGRAYAAGFLAHYVLDTSMHPFVYFNELQICDAGVPGLSRDNGGVVHAEIERQLDEMVLACDRSETVETFNPARQILCGSEHMLSIASTMHAVVTERVYGQAIPQNAFARSVKCFRLVQTLFYSPSGIKRELAGGVEEMFRPYSLFKAMSHRPVQAETCSFSNDEHAQWSDPFTGEVSNDSFWTRYEKAQARYLDAFGQISAACGSQDIADQSLVDQTLEDVTEGITLGRDFSGKPADVDWSHVPVAAIDAI